MTLTKLRRFARLAPAIVALTVVIGSASPVAAVTCTADLGACFQQAAAIEGFWARTAYALDCELTYAQCVREALGY